MPIALADKIVALLNGLSPCDIEALPPAERRRFADVCRRAAHLAEPPAKPAIQLPGPKSQGVLADLRGGERVP